MSIVSNSILVRNGSPTYLLTGFPLDLENLEKWEYTWKTWKYGILKNLINIMEKWHETWKTCWLLKIHPDSLETIQNSLNYWSRKEGLLIWSMIEMINFLFKWNSIILHIYIQNHLEAHTLKIMKKIPGNLLKRSGNMEFCQYEKVGTLLLVSWQFSVSIFFS